MDRGRSRRIENLATPASGRQASASDDTGSKAGVRGRGQRPVSLAGVQGEGHVLCLDASALDAAVLNADRSPCAGGA